MSKHTIESNQKETVVNWKENKRDFLKNKMLHQNVFALPSLDFLNPKKNQYVV